MGTLKIKKVDDKPMVIHTKKKAKIHMHEPKKAKIKGSNIYTVQRGPKIASAKINDTGKKKSYRKSTIHQAEKKEKEPSKFKRNIRESNTSIKTKNTNLHIAGRTGALATGAVTEQVEGGQEVSQAAYLAYEASRPVTFSVGSFSGNQLYDQLEEQYLMKHKPQNPSSTMEMWKIREQAKMQAEEVVLHQIVMKFH